MSEPEPEEHDDWPELAAVALPANEEPEVGMPLTPREVMRLRRERRGW